MSATTDKVSWEQMREAMETLELHLTLAINHRGVLTFEKRTELEQRLEALKVRINQLSAD